MKQVILEIRDRATFIPVIATKLESADDIERYYLRRSGFGGAVFVTVSRLEDAKTEYDPYKWNDRTMQTAHVYIQAHIDDLTSGDVVDVEYILGEVKAPKISERLD